MNTYLKSVILSTKEDDLVSINEGEEDENNVIAEVKKNLISIDRIVETDVKPEITEPISLTVKIIQHSYNSKMYGFEPIVAKEDERNGEAIGLLDVVAWRLFISCLKNKSICREIYNEDRNFFVHLIRDECNRFLSYFINQYVPFVKNTAVGSISNNRSSVNAKKISISPPDLMTNKEKLAYGIDTEKENESQGKGKKGKKFRGPKNKGKKILLKYNPFTKLGASLFSSSMYQTVVDLLNSRITSNEVINLRYELNQEVLKVMEVDTERGRKFIKSCGDGNWGQEKLLCNFELRRLLNCCIKTLNTDNQARAWLLIYLVD